MEVALIFFLQVTFVTLMTLRWIILFKGNRRLATFISFFEITIWVVALGLVVTDLLSPARIIAYALGHATGVALGSWLEERLAYGFSLVLLVAKDGVPLAQALRDRGFAVTQWEGAGKTARRDILLILFRRRFFKALQKTVEGIQPDAFVLALEPRIVRGGFLSRRLPPIPSVAQDVMANVFGSDNLDSASPPDTDQAKNV